MVDGCTLVSSLGANYKVEGNTSDAFFLTRAEVLERSSVVFLKTIFDSLLVRCKKANLSLSRSAFFLKKNTTYKCKSNQF